jgi:hypothetical protein
MKQVELIRAYVKNRLVYSMRVWISTLPETEHEALERLHGTQGELTADFIADKVLYALGHRKPSDVCEADTKRPRGRPRKEHPRPEMPCEKEHA